jgi:hypothetical protein
MIQIQRDRQLLEVRFTRQLPYHLGGIPFVRLRRLIRTLLLVAYIRTVSVFHFFGCYPLKRVVE